jgi:hypothetical protein
MNKNTASASSKLEALHEFRVAACGIFSLVKTLSDTFLIHFTKVYRKLKALRRLRKARQEMLMAANTFPA